jgi:cyclic pyranopterin monophosphate synthase
MHIITEAFKMLTHLDKNGNAIMVDVADKSISAREAEAEGEISITSKILEAIKQQTLKKGDLFTVAKIAAINAAKQTSTFIPLCHQIPLDFIDVKFNVDEKQLKIKITTQVKTSYKTGVEMEALMAVNIGLITIYDMCKALSKDMVISNIRLSRKTGGKSGDYELIRKD